MLGICLAILVSGSALAQNQPPATMTKIVVRLMGPGIRPGSFSALPKTIYRAGEHYARIEDPPDARQHVQKLTVIAEPDAYSANLIDKRGTHAIDEGGANDLHLPIVLPLDPTHKLPELDRLEFGDELGFFEDAGATKQAGPIINGQPTDAYRLKTAEGSATLVVNPRTHAPIILSWQTPEGTYKYEYIIYKQLPFDSALFERPKGITYREVPPPADDEDH